VEKYTSIISWNVDRKYISDETKWYICIKDGKSVVELVIHKNVL
jgi:hypothetical protein